MGGQPDWFQVTNLECIGPLPALPGSPMKDVIVVQAAGGDAFSLVVTFEGTNSFPPSWLGLAEASSDIGPAIPATAEFWAESIGPGEAEVLVGTATVTLTAGGSPGGSLTVNTSLYQARLDVADANTIFVDGGGVLQPGVYRIACAVHTEWLAFGLLYADAYYQDDLLVRVVER